jgi:two-component system, sensor histidine kinase YesM
VLYSVPMLAVPNRNGIPTLRFRLGLFFILVAVPLAALLVFQNIYAVSVVHGQLSESMRNLLGQYTDRIDSELRGVDTYLVSKIINDNALFVFDKGSGEDDYGMSKIELTTEFTNDVALYKSIAGIFAYSSRTGDLVMGLNASMGLLSLEDRQAIREFLASSLELPNRDWIFRTIGSRERLFRVLRSGDSLVGAWSDTAAILSPLKPLSPNSRGRFAFVTRDGVSHPHIDEALANRVDIVSSDRPYRVSGKPAPYLVIGVDSAMGGFRLVSLVPDSDILQQLPAFRTINILIGAMVLLLVLAFFMSIRRAIMRPLGDIMSAMTRLSIGDFSRPIDPDLTSREFAVADDMFNLMASEIRDLRINIYEEQLHAQKAELLSLRLQINPHFFLNSLNIIYQLAQVRDFALVQELSLCLSRYFQFMFQSGADLVALKDEWEHLKNYLRIQELRFPTSLVCALEAPDPLPDIDIPPLLLHTFAENAVQHGMRYDRGLTISIWMAFRSEEGRLTIRIEDSGKGFPEETLERLRTGESIVDERGEHIGIANIRRRLGILYGGAASLDIKNRPAPESGGIVEITIACAAGRPAACSQTATKFLR